MSTNLQRIAELAKQMPDLAFTSLNGHLNFRLLYEACHRTRKTGAVGVDGQTWEDFKVNFSDHINELLTAAHTGTYRAPPVRRVHIPKGGSTSETRPLGIPTFSDKVLQRAVAMLLEPIYENDFDNGSYGFRPGRSAQQAIDDLRNWLVTHQGGWVLDVDVQKFFDTIDHGHLREFLQRRVKDGVLLRLIGKWLKAGVLEEGRLSYPREGTPQGGVISPLLANIYLHYVLDEWIEQEVSPRMRGALKLVRYADDFVLAFTHESDARRVLEVLGQRFAKYGLTVHPDKTRLVRFERPGSGRDQNIPAGRPETFDLLGFTFHWGRARRGSWTVKTKTASSRVRRTLSRIDDWCRINRHLPVTEQQERLSRQLQGHYNYFGRPGNYHSLWPVYRGVLRSWYRWLRRRNRRSHFTWKRFWSLLERHPLPLRKIVPRGP